MPSLKLGSFSHSTAKSLGDFRIVLAPLPRIWFYLPKADFRVLSKHAPRLRFWRGLQLLTLATLEHSTNDVFWINGQQLKSAILFAAGGRRPDTFDQLPAIVKLWSLPIGGSWAIVFWFQFARLMKNEYIQKLKVLHDRFGKSHVDIWGLIWPRAELFSRASRAASFAALQASTRYKAARFVCGDCI